jgi:quercetin dioxygenase-like cupin family protein
VEIRRFGIGHRQHDGPPGTHGVEATPVHVDDRGVVAELALKPNAGIAPQSNPNLSYLLVIEGGGFVQVGEERARVAAGEAVVWPPNVVHAAWTELTPMRAIVVEFAPAEAGAEPARLSEGGAAELTTADGGLAPEPPVLPPNRKSPDQEPW